jgi:hypothetical protein
LCTAKRRTNPSAASPNQKHHLNRRQQATEETKEWTINSNSLFPLFSPVQKNLRKKQYLYWRSHLDVVLSNCVALTRPFFESLQWEMEEGRRLKAKS